MKSKLNYKESIEKILSARDATATAMKNVSRIARRFLEHGVYSKKIQDFRKSIFDEFDKEQSNLPTLMKGFHDFILSDFTNPIGFLSVCDFLEKKFIPDVEEAYKSYTTAFSDIYATLNVSLTNLKNAHQKLEDIERQHHEFIEEIEDLYATRTSKKNEDTFNSKIYDYRPLRENIDECYDNLNLNLSEFYKACDTFLLNYEKVENDRSIRFNMILNSLNAVVAKADELRQDSCSSFVNLNDSAMRSDISNTFTWDTMEWTTRLPALTPDLDLKFNIYDYLDNDQILRAQSAYQYAIAKKEIKFNQGVIATPGERITTVRYSGKLFKVTDNQDPIPINEDDVELKPEFARYLAVVTGKGSLHNRKVVVVCSGPTCECMDSCGMVKFIPEAYLERL